MNQYGRGAQQPWGPTAPRKLRNLVHVLFLRFELKFLGMANRVKRHDLLSSFMGRRYASYTGVHNDVPSCLISWGCCVDSCSESRYRDY